NLGVVNLGSAASISSGALTLTGAATTLQAIQAVTFTQAVTLNNASLTFGNTGPGVNVPVTFSGVTTLVGPSTLTITNTAGIYFNGQVTDGGVNNTGSLVLAGGGTVFLSNANSTNAGGSGTNLN